MDNTFASFDEWAAAQARCDAAYEAAYEIDPSTAYDAYRAASDVEIAAARRRRADEALEAAADELSATERAAIDALDGYDADYKEKLNDYRDEQEQVRRPF